MPFGKTRYINFFYQKCWFDLILGHVIHISLCTYIRGLKHIAKDYAFFMYILYYFNTFDTL